ncbi:hypothetical protein ACET3Z_010324 [Daucus carota]
MLLSLSPVPRGSGLFWQKLEVHQKHLNRLNKPPIKSIQSPDGDTIYFIPISHQPAFEHLLLKDQNI